MLPNIPSRYLSSPLQQILQSKTYIADKTGTLRRGVLHKRLLNNSLVIGQKGINKKGAAVGISSKIKLKPNPIVKASLKQIARIPNAIVYPWKGKAMNPKY